LLPLVYLDRSFGYAIAALHRKSDVKRRWLYPEIIYDY